MDCLFLEQCTEMQINTEDLPGENVALMTKLPEAGLEVTWFKDNVPFSMIDGKSSKLPEVELEDN